MTLPPKDSMRLPCPMNVRSRSPADVLRTSFSRSSRPTASGTKAAAEEIVRGSPLLWTIFRPSLIYGAEGEFTRMLSDWARGRRAPWLFMPYFGTGILGTGRKSLVQPVRVEDVARAFVDAIEKPASAGREYEFGGEDRLTWPEMYRVFARSVRGKAKATVAIPAWYAALLTRIVPAALLPFNRAQIAMSQEDSVADLKPFIEDFGFTPMGLEKALGAPKCGKA